MVAKGVIARTVEHLWDTDKRIDIVYICSNGQIARQNLSRLNVVGGSEVKHADRLTLLPRVIRNLRGQQVNFVSFTPGTSFKVGQHRRCRAGTGAPVLDAGRRSGVATSRPCAVEAGSSRAACAATDFEDQLGCFDRTIARRRAVPRRSATRSSGTTGPDGGSAEDELEACADAVQLPARQAERPT